mgnify:CR=1 FL=1
MIHQYKLNGFNIVLDTFSGAVHCVDDVTYDIIKLYDEKVEKLIKAKSKNEEINIKLEILDEFYKILSLFLK